jgi:hypothetical protein
MLTTVLLADNEPGDFQTVTRLIYVAVAILR